MYGGPSVQTVLKAVKKGALAVAIYGGSEAIRPSLDAMGDLGSLTRGAALTASALYAINAITVLIWGEA